MNSKQQQRSKRLLKAAYVAAVLASSATVAPAWAQDATWDGPGTNWNDPVNWEPDSVPGNTATFNQEGNNQPNPALTANANINQILFQSGSTNYTISTNQFRLSVNGTGIDNNSGELQVFIVNDASGVLRFQNSATITETNGNVRIENQTGGNVRFNDTSSAGTSRIINSANGITTFANNSNAGNAVIVNNTGGTTNFNANSAAGDGLNDGLTARIVNDGGITNFNNLSQALDAEIVNRNGGATFFNNNSSANTATIINGDNGSTTFSDSSNANQVSILNRNGGTTYFSDGATAALATIENRSGGVVDISGTNAPGIGIGNLFGAGDVYLGAQRLRTGMTNQDATISGVIQDGGIAGGTGGSLVKEGTGILTLRGDNTYTGTTTVNNGVLDIRGSITSDTTVETDGELWGRGTIDGDLTNNGGILAPGDEDNDYRNLRVTGNVNITNSDSIFTNFSSRDADGTRRSNALIVGGDANLDGQVRTFVDPDGTYLVNNRFLLVRANGVNGLNGTEFDSVDTPSSNIPIYLTLADTAYADGLDYTASEAFLVLRRNSLFDLQDGDYTRNERSLFNALNGADFGNLTPEQEEFINAFILGNGNNASLLSGDALTSYPLAAQGAANRFNQNLLLQALLRYRQDAELLSRRPNGRLAYTGDRFASLLAQGEAAPTASAADSASTRRSHIWATIGRAKEDGESDGNGPGFDARATEYSVGVSRNISNRTLVGLAIGKSDGDVDVNERAAEADLDTTSIGAFIRHDSDNFYVSGLLSYSRHNIDSERETGIGTARADYDARTLALWGEVGKKMQRGGWNIEPNVSLKFSNTRQDSFNESGPGGLSVDDESYNTRRLGLGVRITSRDENARIRPHLSLGYEREFGDRKAELTNSLGGGISAFNVDSTELGRNIFSLRLGADARLNDRFSIIGEVGASWRSNQDSQFIYGGVKYGF